MADENKNLQEENVALKKQLKDAHEAIADAEDKTPGNPMLTIAKEKYELVIPKANYPTGKHTMREVTLAELKKDKKFAEQLVKEKYAGLVKVNPKD